MAKLQSLIKNQKISFDTHQAGDGQETKWRNVHLEKSIKNKKGKARFPFLGNEKPSNSGMSEKDFKSIIKEVSKVLNKDKVLLEELAIEIEKELHRFSSGLATIEDAIEAAKRFSKYFDLEADFIDDVAKFRRGRLIEFTTLHYSKGTQELYSIKQSNKRITFEQRYKKLY